MFLVNITAPLFLPYHTIRHFISSEVLIDKENREKMSNKRGADVVKEALPNVGSSKRDQVKEQKAAMPQKPDLKKSKSYGAPSTLDYAPPKQKVKHSLSATPNSAKNSKGMS